MSISNKRLTIRGPIRIKIINQNFRAFIKKCVSLRRTCYRKPFGGCVQIYLVFVTIAFYSGREFQFCKQGTVITQTLFSYFYLISIPYLIAFAFSEKTGSPFKITSDPSQTPISLEHRDKRVKIVSVL